jgi:hypothetical protein
MIVDSVQQVFCTRAMLNPESPSGFGASLCAGEGGRERSRLRGMNSTERPDTSALEVANEEFPSDGAIGFCADQRFDHSSVRGLFTMSSNGDFLHGQRNNVHQLFQLEGWVLLQYCRYKF